MSQEFLFLRVKPVRVKLQKEDESEAIIKVDRVITTEKEKFAENEMLLFRWQSVINNQQKLFELKYELKICKWMLFKIWRQIKENLIGFIYLLMMWLRIKIIRNEIMFIFLLKFVII